MNKKLNNLQTLALMVAAIATLAIGFSIVNNHLANVQQFNPHKPADSSIVESGLLTLNNSPDVSKRVAAARFFADHPLAISSSLIQELGQVLAQDKDAQVRAAVATAIGKSHRKFAGELQDGFYEPQLLEILLAAYQNEKSAAVRIEIVRAAAEFDHADAATIINQSLEDQDSSVRETGFRVKHYREQRMTRARIG